MITSILEGLDFKPKGIDHIISPSAEVLGECYEALMEQIPQKLETWGIAPQELMVDYTSGTKTMSVGIVLATIELGCTYSYVGGRERDKGGVGVVLDGKEKMWYLNNPWDELAISERKKVNLLFNKARYASALEILQDICTKVSQQKRPFYQMWVEVIQGYELWDKFDHKGAWHHLKKGLHQLKVLAAKSVEFQEKTEEIEEGVVFLKQLIKGENRGEMLAYDLIANAKRRAELEAKYDDAVARLYRAIEKIAQERLHIKVIDPSSVDPKKIPPSLREEYLRKYTQESKIKLPLYASYRLLKELGDELGHRFFERYEGELKPLLDTRNSSILAHGDRSVTKEVYQRLLRVVIGFAQLEEERIPEFPKLEI